MTILLIISVILLPIILLFLVAKLASTLISLIPRRLTNRTYLISLCVQLISIGFYCLISEYYFHQCSMCNGDGTYLIVSFISSFILLLSLGINFSISNNTTYPITTNLTNYMAIIPYYVFSLITILTTYAFTVEPLFH